MCEIRHDAAADAGAGWSTAQGCYEDDYARAADGWRFAGRRYRSMARTGAEAAILGLPPDIATGG